MDIKPSIKEMENQESAEFFNNIPIKHEAQPQNCEHPFSADELKATVKIENFTEASVTHLVKTELFEFHNNAVDVDLSDTIKEGNYDLYNSLDKKSDSNSDSDPERDPFADVHCDPSFSKTPQCHDSSASATHSRLTNSPKTDANKGLLNLSSFAKGKLSTARILKHNFQRKTPHLDCTLQCQLCLVSQGSEIELRTHLEICAASHRHGNRFCVICNELFSTCDVSKNHDFTVHKISSSTQCGLCFEKLNSKSELKTHLENCAASHANSFRFCVPCNKSFSTVNTLKQHAFRIHSNLSTARISKRKVGRKILHLDYTLQCHLCLVTQGSEKELKTHFDICVASHRHGNRFCVLCNKLFSTPYVNKNHASTKHGISYLIQCGLCLEDFNSESELETHLEICAASHSDSRRFCVPCNKLLCSVNSLKEHAFSIHGIARAVKRRKNTK